MLCWAVGGWGGGRGGEEERKENTPFKPPCLLPACPDSCPCLYGREDEGHILYALGHVCCLVAVWQCLPTRQPQQAWGRKHLPAGAGGRGHGSRREDA